MAQAQTQFEGVEFAAPKPMGGPLFGPDGKVMTPGDQGFNNPWSGGAEVGLNGSSGNTEILKIRLGADLKYETPENTFIANAFYGLAQQNGILNESKALATFRDEYPFYDGMAWFGQLQIEYDDFREIDFRLALHSGLSFLAYKDEFSTLKLRAGAGATREVGSPDDRWEPEGIFGFDFDMKISDRTSLNVSTDYYPKLDNFQDYRVRSKAAIEILLDQELNIVLRLGAQNRYDSQPGSMTLRNDLDYFMTLLWRFG
jgi:putative salt-induced outer membrane protein YdiY